MPDVQHPGPDDSTGKRGLMTPPDAFQRWQPMMKAYPAPPNPAAVAAARDNPVMAGELAKPREMASNHLYTATVYRNEDGVINCLSVKRNNKRAVSDWRHLQQIKNELAGRDVEAIQLFPAQDRVVDTANQVWLFCFPPGVRLPVGFPEGAIGGPDEAVTVGASQRAFEPGLGFGEGAK